MASRIMPGLKQECARCDHDLEESRAIRSRFRKMRCKKCGATFYEDRLTGHNEPGRRP